MNSKRVMWKKIGRRGNSLHAGEPCSWQCISTTLRTHTMHHILLWSSTFSLTTTPTNIPIKSYWIGLIPMHTIFSFLVWPISPPPFKFTKGDIAHMIDLLEPNLLLSYNIFPSRSYQKLLWGLWFSYRNFWQDHHPQPIKFIRPSNISIMLRV